MKQSWPQQELNPGPLTLQPDALPLHHRALHVKLEKIEGYEVPSSSLFAKNNILILCQFMIHKPPYNFQSSPKYDEKVGLKFWKRAAPSRTRSRVPWLGSQTLYHYTKELWMTILRKLKDMKFLVHHSFKFAKKQYFFIEEM